MKGLTEQKSLQITCRGTNSSPVSLPIASGCSQDVGKWPCHLCWRDASGYCLYATTMEQAIRDMSSLFAHIMAQESGHKSHQHEVRFTENSSYPIQLKVWQILLRWSNGSMS